MIRYHGGPCTPIEAALELWAGRHALISFAYPQQIDFVAKHAHSFVLDNGAFTAWENGSEVNWADYAKWVEQYQQHPGFDMCLIPDKIDGNEAENDELLAWWDGLIMATPGVPVWHMHESLKNLPPKQRALMMAFDADRHKSAARWAGSTGVQENMEFY